MRSNVGLWTLVLTLSWFLGLTPSVDAQVTPGALVQTFVRGDYTGDSVVQISDAIGVLGYLFTPGTPEPPCADAGDANDDGDLNVGDAVLILSYLFADGIEPSAPFPSCGVDLSSDAIGCAGASLLDCPLVPLELQFIWPMPGADTDDWVINNYVDLDPGPGIVDYMGGSKAYNNHDAIDIDVPNFRWMDNNFPIFAAAAGTVVDTEDSNEDRHMSCYGDWNFVTIEHWNGWRTIYGHLKQYSVTVNVGDFVVAGEVIGVVGSSGCSTAPHLHFVVRDENNNTVDPFLEDMFINPPVYNTPLGFMDAAIYRNTVNSVAQILDPPANVEVVEPGDTLGIGLSMAGGGPGDTIQMFLRRPNGSLYDSYTNNLPQVYRHSYWWWNPSIPTSGPLGYWELEIRTNGITAATYPIYVGEVLTGYQQVRHGIPASSYQQLFDNFVANGYRPVWVDGFDLQGAPYFNMIFDKSPAAGWFAHHGLSGAGLQSTFDSLTSSGYRLVHIDSYNDNGNLRFATIYEGGSGPAFAAYSGATLSAHQAQFDSLTAAGYRAKNLSFTEIGSTTYVTGLYDTASVGGWVALANMTKDQFQTQFDNWTAAGLTLSYLDAYEEGGVGKYSAIWDSVNPSAWAANHDLSSGGFQDAFDNWTGMGLTTRFVTAHWYIGGSLFAVPVLRYSGMWSN